MSVNFDWNFDSMPRQFHTFLGMTEPEVEYTDTDMLTRSHLEKEGPLR